MLKITPLQHSDFTAYGHVVFRGIDDRMYSQCPSHGITYYSERPAGGYCDGCLKRLRDAPGDAPLPLEDSIGDRFK